MNAKQTAAMLGRFVEHSDAFFPLPTPDGEWARVNPKDAAKLCIAAIRGRNNLTQKPGQPQRTYTLLKPLTPPASEPMTFKADTTFFNKKSGVKMVEHGSNFNAWFMGKIEEAVKPAQLTAFQLAQGAFGADIIKELGGEEAAEVNLVDVWRLMERQANGENGILLTNGCANIFYVKDANGVLRAVDVYWYGDGWLVNALALGYDRWVAGYRVFARNS